MDNNLIDVNMLREELKFAEKCDDCKRSRVQCECENFYMIRDFCEMLDFAIDAVKERMKKEKELQDV